MRGVLLAVTVILVAGCPTDETYIIVTVDHKPAVHDAATLKVALTNGGTTRMDDLTLNSKTFPVTFSVTTPGRTGDLTIAIDALDSTGALVGRGLTSTTVLDLAPTVMLDSADFVVNTEVAEDQFPSNDFEAHGFQLAANADGSLWTAAWRDKCLTPCNMFGRRFDVTGKPVATKVAASTMQFNFTTNLTTSASTPAVATAGANTLAFWDFSDPNVAATGVACRALDAQGMASPDQVAISTDPSPDVVAVAPLSNGNFAVSWNSFQTTQLIRSAIVKPDCTTLGVVVTTSQPASTSPRRAAVATSGNTVMYVWMNDGQVRYRVANMTNAFLSVDAEFLPKRTTEAIDHVRIAPFGAGYAVLVRTSGLMTTRPGKIELFRTNNMGMIQGTSILVTDKAGSDFESTESFGVATRSDGTLLVVWHACAENGDGSSCGVFGRAIKSDGSPLGPQFAIPTTTANNQLNPSAVALGATAFAVVWKDDSTTEPDHSGSAIRGRVIYPGANGVN